VSLPIAIASRLGRTLLLMLFAAAGTILLVRFAPGFFSDSREMDARYAQAAQAEIQAENSRQESVGQIALRELKSLRHGDFGESRQYHVPVAELIGARLRVSAMLLAQGILRGWLLALCVALPVSALRRGGFLWGAPFTLVLSIPTAAMATACILAEAGGPVLVLALLIAAREFKFLRSLLAGAWRWCACTSCPTWRRNCARSPRFRSSPRWERWFPWRPSSPCRAWASSRGPR
jgi:peptide/nickel transport system permease protein